MIHVQESPCSQWFTRFWTSPHQARMLADIEAIAAAGGVMTDELLNTLRQG